MTINFVTFGSHKNYVDAGKRLIKQAKNLKIFKETILYTANNLKNDKSFWEKHKDFIENNKRGYGYWLWKPYIILKTMNRMKDNDILLYLDCGCEINCQERNYFLKCIEKVKKDKIIGTKMRHIEKDWNKMDLITKLNMNEDIYINTPQRQAGVVLYLVCKETRELVNEWYNLGCEYNNINDSPSVIPNLSGFREHRHDQSIFSLLSKKYNLYSDFTLNEKCIKIFRNKTGNSRLKTSVNNIQKPILKKFIKICKNKIKKPMPKK
jgi:hypothetical protein